MMSPVPEHGPLDLQRLLELRRATSAVARGLEAELRGHLDTLAPLLRPKLLLGDFIAGASAESRPDAESAFRDLTSLYTRVAPKPFRLPARLDKPVPAIRVRLELHPVEDVVVAGSAGRRLVVVSPFAWVIGYPGACGVGALRRMLAGEDARNDEEIRTFVLGSCILHLLVERSPTLGRLFEALRFELGTRTLPDLGELPVPVVRSVVPSMRPDPALMLDAADLAGQSTFSEVIDVERALALEDPLRARLTSALK
jgi:hypothetical protein